jgi:UDP-glucose 4-epimerase
MTILVTGGAGLIGMQLRDTLRAAGRPVVAIDVTDYGRADPDLVIMSLDDAEALERLVADRKVTAIAHCGAISGPMLAKGRPMLMVDVNIVATARLLELARRHAMQRFVFCSSISVYGNVGPGLITERTPLHPTSVYGATKVACEALVEGFAAEYGVDGISLRISRVYGPYRRANCHLGNIIRDADAGRPTEIACAPDFAYHYVYAQDIAEAILHLLDTPNLPSRAYNVGAARGYTMPEIAAIAGPAIAGAAIRLVPGVDDVPDVQETFDVSLIGREAGWQPRFDIAAGLRDYRDAIRSGRAATGD